MSQTEVQLIKSSSVVDDDIVGMSSSKLSGTLPAVSGANLTNLPAANLTGALPAISGANLTGISAGISEADLWRVNAGLNSPVNGAYVTANWERADTDGFTKIGTGMTESSGNFSFPSTGIYLISWAGWAYTQSSDHTVGINISVTQDGASNWTTASGTYFSIPNVDTYSYNNAYTETVFDVTNTSTHRVRFYLYASSSGVTWDAGTNSNNVYAKFIRLGDT